MGWFCECARVHTCHAPKANKLCGRQPRSRLGCTAGHSGMQLVLWTHQQHSHTENDPGSCCTYFHARTHMVEASRLARGLSWTQRRFISSCTSAARTVCHRQAESLSSAAGALPPSLIWPPFHCPFILPGPASSAAAKLLPCHHSSRAAWCWLQLDVWHLRPLPQPAQQRERSTGLLDTQAGLYQLPCCCRLGPRTC